MNVLVKKKISPEEFKKITDASLGMTKLVVDIEQEVLALGCELHTDCADKLIEDGSNYKNLWGVNIYHKDKRIDFVSLINIRPQNGNRSMEIEDKEIRDKIEIIINKLLF